MNANANHPAASLATTSPLSGITYLPPAEQIPAVRFAVATIYRTGEFFGGVHKVEARDVEIRIVRWAQYSHAIEVTFTPKGKRKARRIVDSYNPSTLILEGVGHPDPESLWDESTRRGDDTVSSVRSKHTCFDPAWRATFDAMIAEHVAAMPAGAVADFRKHNPNGRIDP